MRPLLKLFQYYRGKYRPTDEERWKLTVRVFDQQQQDTTSCGYYMLAALWVDKFLTPSAKKVYYMKHIGIGDVAQLSWEMVDRDVAPACIYGLDYTPEKQRKLYDPKQYDLEMTDDYVARVSRLLTCRTPLTVHELFEPFEK